MIFEKSNNEVLAESIYPHDDHFSVYSESGEIITYDYRLNRLSKKTINPINSLGFSINSLLSIDGNSYFSATTYDKRFPASEYLSEQNMIMRKTDHEKEIASYTFDGMGTSRVYFNDLRMVDNNYVLSAHICVPVSPVPDKTVFNSVEQDSYIFELNKMCRTK